MEDVDGVPICETWRLLEEEQKEVLARNVTNVMVNILEVRSPYMWGLDTWHQPAPTVEGSELFNGRFNFHTSEFYDIGPYPSKQAYVFLCYDK